MSYRPDMRASDGDRDRIADRLREAHSEGRLAPEEFDSRLDALLAAQTYGELEPLVRDLPAKPTPSTEPARPAAAPAPSASSKPTPTRVDKGLRAAWLVWSVTVSVNLVVWLLVSVNNGTLEYFWPIWVAGPWGAVLVTLSGFRYIFRD